MPRSMPRIIFKRSLGNEVQEPIVRAVSAEREMRPFCHSGHVLWESEARVDVGQMAGEGQNWNTIWAQIIGK